MLVILFRVAFTVIVTDFILNAVVFRCKVVIVLLAKDLLSNIAQLILVVKAGVLVKFLWPRSPLLLVFRFGILLHLVLLLQLVLVG